MYLCLESWKVDMDHYRNGQSDGALDLETLHTIEVISILLLKSVT